MSLKVASSLLCLAIALFATATGQLLFKMYYVRARRVFLFSALGTFIIVPAFSYLALLNLSLAAVYMSTAFTNVLVLVMSRIFLDEIIAKRHMIAMAFIVAGIFIFNY